MQGSLTVFRSTGLMSTTMTRGLIALFWWVIENGFVRLRRLADNLGAAE
jgi:hypothetical protein